MKILLLILALTIPGTAQIERLMKQGANVTLKDRALVFVPVKFEPCDLVWQIRSNNTVTRETSLSLADLDPERIRVEPVRDEQGIVQLMLYTVNAREVITEQSVHRDNSRGEASHKSVQVILIKRRSTADKLVDAFTSGINSCMAKGSNN